MNSRVQGEKGNWGLENYRVKGAEKRSFSEKREKV